MSRRAAERCSRPTSRLAAKGRSPRNLTFRDDQLISHLRGGQLAYFLCTPGDSHINPRKADYQVDLENLDSAIDRWIAAA